MDEANVEIPIPKSRTAFRCLLKSPFTQFSDKLVTYEQSKGAEAKTHRELKEMLYYDAIKLFEQGKIWEEGITLCKELERQYEHETFQYKELAKLLVSYDSLMFYSFYDCCRINGVVNICSVVIYTKNSPCLQLFWFIPQITVTRERIWKFPSPKLFYKI